MAVTSEVALTGAWQAIATAGEVIFTADRPLVWAITGSASAPSFSSGHINPAYVDEAMTLTGSERLWVKSSTASGIVNVTADAPG